MENQNRKLWFRRKRYGYGWYPVSWQGWLVLFVYLAIILTKVVYINQHLDPDTNLLVNFVVPILIPTVLLLIICYAKGEKPKWQWGESKEK